MPTSLELTVFNKVGLHARPAAQFVKKAASFKAQIQVENLSKATKAVNAKSLLSLLSISVQKDDRIRITANGEDESRAVDALRELVESNFGEDA